jgi:hypothetical protein
LGPAVEDSGMTRQVRMVEEGNWRRGENRENRKNNNLEESREAEERRRWVVCWKKWMAGPMRATYPALGVGLSEWSPSAWQKW